MACYFCRDNPSEVICPNCGSSGGKNNPDSDYYTFSNRIILNEDAIFPVDSISRYIEDLIDVNSLKNTNFKNELDYYISNISPNEKIRNVISKINQLIKNNWINQFIIYNGKIALEKNDSHVKLGKGKFVLVKEIELFTTFLNKRKNISNINNFTLKKIKKIDCINNKYIKYLDFYDNIYKIIYDDETYFIEQIHVENEIIRQAVDKIIIQLRNSNISSKIMKTKNNEIADILSKFQFYLDICESNDGISNLNTFIDSAPVANLNLENLLWGDKYTIIVSIFDTI